jgi:gamma-glutamyltranspeptidase/glutathione hydrolase
MELFAVGGNAVDAAVGANAVLGVVAPETCGPGGDLFALVHRPGETAPLTLNASGRAGAGAHAAELRRLGATEVPLYGPWSITVPGCVDGWLALLSRAGTMTIADVLAPAIRHAGGFPASPELSAALARGQQRIGGQQAAAALYPGGEPPEAGALIVRPDLEATLRAIAEKGRAGFYSGAAGAGILSATEGRITGADLAHDQAEWIEPLRADVMGQTLWTIPPNSQGYLVAAAAWIAEQLDPPADPDSPAYVHALVEAYRSVAWERDDLVADPGHAPLPSDDLVSPGRLRSRSITIGERAGTWPAPSPAPGGTAYLCVADRDGVGISLIQSNFHGIGSGLGAGESGVFLQNRGAGFTIEPGHPNEMKPGKRPLHTLSPTLWTNGSNLELLLGTRGGHQQPQLLLQVAAHLFLADQAPAMAQALPRWTTDVFGPGAGSVLKVEGRMPRDVIADLSRRGHEVIGADDWMEGWGPVSLIRFGSDGLRTAAADPRVSTALAAVR